MVGVPIGTGGYVLDRAIEVVRVGGADRLARCLTSMPDKAAALIAIESPGQRTSYLERALDTGLSLEACRRADNGAQCAYENILELPGAAEAQSFFHEGCPGNQLTLNPDQQAQARLSTGTGGLGLPSTIARRMSASLGSRVGILPESLADLTGPLGDRVRTGLPEKVAACGRSETDGGSQRNRWQESSPSLDWSGSRRRGGPAPKAPRGGHAGCARRRPH